MRGQSQRSCHPGPEENRSKTHLSSIRRTPGHSVSLLQKRQQNTWEEDSNPDQPSQCHHGARMVKTGEAAGPAVMLPGLVTPHPLEGRQVLPGPGLGPVLLCPGHFLCLPTARLEPTTRDGLIDMVSQNRVSKKQRSRVPEPMAVPATCHRGLGHRLSQALMCCWRRRRCSILPLHIWGSLLRKAQRLQFPTWLGTDSRGGLPKG